MTDKDSNLKEMSLIDHITELRKRLLWSFLYIIIIFVICFYFADQLFAFLAAPLVDLLDTEKRFLKLRVEGLTMEEISNIIGESAYRIRQGLQNKLGELQHAKTL